VGEGAGEAAEDVGEGAGEAAEQAGEGAGEAAGDVAETATDAADDAAGGAAQKAGEAAEEADVEGDGGALEGVLDEEGRIADEALGDVIDLAIEADIIKRQGGSWYAFEDETIGQGHDAIVSWLRENSEMREVVSQRLSDVFSPSQETSEESAKQQVISERTDAEGRTVRRVQDPSGALTFEYVLSEDGDVESLEMVEES
ncbi:MAG: hypothetical protein BRD29_04600, partial [Bacteroidetes bacterium QH_2_67_10]